MAGPPDEGVGARARRPWGRWALPAFVAAVVATGLWLRLWVAWQPIETQTVKTLQDDAFYYFVTAQHIVDGQGISFDGFTTSNGYHPLWLFFTVPFFLVLPGRDLPVHAALTGAALLDVAAACLVALAVRRLTSQTPAALFALIFYLLLPRNVISGVNGVESSMACFMLAALLLAFVSYWRAPRDDWLRPAFVTGALGGLTVLARFDSALVVFVTLGLIGLFQRGSRRWQATGLALGVCALVVAPWSIWSLAAVGTPLPESGAAATWLIKRHYYAFLPDASLGDAFRQGWTYTKVTFNQTFRQYYFPREWLAWTIGLALLAVSAHFAFLVPRELGRKTAERLVIAGAPLAGFAAVLFVNTMYRWFFREWYFAWGMPAVVLMAGVLFAYVCDVIASQEARLRAATGLPQGAASYAALAVVVAVLAAGYIGPGREIWQSPRLAHEADRLQAAAYLKEHTPPGTRIAAFNAGVVAFFSERPVVNIDGVVNPDAYDALRDDRLLAYLREVHVEYVVDRDQAWRALPAFIRPDDWSQSLWGEDPNAAMEPVETFGPRQGFYGQLTLFRIVR